MANKNRIIESKSCCNITVKRKIIRHITNIQKDISDAKDTAKLCRVRWDIELLFKELKSKYAPGVLDINIRRCLQWSAPAQL
ncbi:transposase [Methanosarcina horonobensis]|nr:transposase [Methanosarcina horonobensis]